LLDLVADADEQVAAVALQSLDLKVTRRDPGAGGTPAADLAKIAAEIHAVCSSSGLSQANEAACRKIEHDGAPR
jgi:hypothetical protein